MWVMFVAIFFIVTGLISLFWSEAMRDYIFKNSFKPEWFKKILFNSGYIVLLRVIGFLSIVVGCYLIWLCLMK